MAIKKEKSFGARFPTLAEEWAQDLNGDVTPYDVLPYSTDIYWWRCKEDSGHVWQASLKSRSVNGSGCRFCRKGKYADVSKLAPRKERIEVSNLQALYPEIAEEWDQEKNSTTPDKVFAGSPVKYHWRCKQCGHQWVAKVSYRTDKKSGCPNCYAENNKLPNTYPEVAARWHPSKNNGLWPIDVSASDDREAHWKCPHCGKAYKRKVSNMVRDPYCPYCESRRKPPIEYEKSLAYQYPEIAKQLHPELNPPGITADQLRPKSGLSFWWKCPDNPEHPPWRAILHNRTAGNQGCPVCAQLKRRQKNRLDLVLPDLASEWDHDKNAGLRPEDVTINYSKPVYWLSPGGGPSYKKTVVSRARSAAGRGL